MSSTRKKPTGFSLRKSRKVQEQPPRNLNLDLINNNNNNDDKKIIILKKDIPELRKKFDYINTLVRSRAPPKDINNDNNADNNDNIDDLIISRSDFPRGYQYSYFKGPSGTNKYSNTAEAISTAKLWSLLQDSLSDKHVPKRYLRILQDYLMDIDKESLSDKLIEQPSHRGQLSRVQTRRANRALNSNNRNNNVNNNNNNSNNNNNNSKLAKSRLIKRRNTKHRRTRQQHTRTKRNYTVKKSIKNLLKR